MVDFTSYDPSASSLAEPPSFDWVSHSEAGNKRPSLSLSACCRIVEEHGGRLLQSSAPGTPAFRMDLQVANTGVSQGSLTAFNRAAAHGSS
jgi:hypothetical protein